VGPLADYVECFWGTESFGTYSRETILPRAVTEVFCPLRAGLSADSGRTSSAV
jgi:hypothetical protein